LEDIQRGDLRNTLHQEDHPQPDWDDNAEHMREVLEGDRTPKTAQDEGAAQKPQEVFMPQILPDGVSKGRAVTRRVTISVPGEVATAETERKMYVGHPSVFNFVTSILSSAGAVAAGVMLLPVNPFILMGGIGLSAVTLGRILIMRRCWCYHITERRVEMIYGFINRSSEEVRIRDIRNINVRREGLRGLLGVGDVEIASAGGGEVEVVFKGVWRPHAVKELIRSIQDQDS